MGSIYLLLRGRIGNQLFQYALARKIQLGMPVGTEIVIDDHEIIQCNWDNSLAFYNLPNVRYQHNNLFDTELKHSSKRLFRKMYRLFTRETDYLEKYLREKRINPLLGLDGVFICENGFIEPRIKHRQKVYLEGYFQSEKYFESVRADILERLDGNQFDTLHNYPGLSQLRKRNSVCISVKVEHNIGSSLYDVCSIDYWKKAIDYISKNVEDPLYFICSDNTEYVLNNLINPDKMDYIVQSKEYPVHISLAAMAECKHFITGNTTFGWWAQYLSKNKGKIVVAPSRWMLVDMPIDIYQDDWHLIDV